MSKIIESLKAGARAGQTLQTEKSSYEMTQEQLADIYFSGSDKAKKSEYPMVIKVIEKSKPSSYLPWLIAAIAFLVTAFSLFSTKKIFVDIKVIDEKNPFLVSALSAQPQNTVDQILNEGTAKQEAPGAMRLPMQNVDFEGAAKLKSSKNLNSLTLVNASIASFARANLYFRNPLDLEGYKIVFYAKGADGGEGLRFGVKDRENMLGFDKGTMNPFPANLTTDWQRAEICLPVPGKGFDAKNVSNIRFEFGSKEAKNKSGDTVYIKDLQVVPL